MGGRKEKRKGKEMKINGGGEGERRALPLKVNVK